MKTAAAILGIIAAVCVVVVTTLLFWRYRAEASLTAKTKGGLVSFGAGFELAGLTVSAGAILGGPGVAVVSFRKRELYKHSSSCVSVESVLAWIDGLLSAPKKEPSRLVRLLVGVKDWLLPRTDLEHAPELGVRLLLALRDLRIDGTIQCGFEDPALTGKCAAVLYPLAGMLSPFGTFDVGFDWSGRTVVDADVDASFRVVPVRMLLEALRFARAHVHLRRKLHDGSVSRTLPA